MEEMLKADLRQDTNDYNNFMLMDEEDKLLLYGKNIGGRKRMELLSDNLLK